VRGCHEHDGGYRSRRFLGAADLSGGCLYFREHAAAEAEKLRAKVWQHAGRVGDVPEVGDFITCEIASDSILIVRAAPDTIKAYHNVCPHRGRRLASTPRGGNGARGKAHKQTFFCSYHGWSFDLDGANTHILDKDGWRGRLTHERTCLYAWSRAQGRTSRTAKHMGIGAPRLLE
jgi:phenylpropionate dioxygenase-like ring-hydroxylating dioxygenase large terminal subunit